MKLKSTTKLSRIGVVLCSMIFALGILSETLSFCVDRAIDVFYFQPIYGPNGKIAKLTAIADSFKEEPAAGAQTLGCAKGWSNGSVHSLERPSQAALQTLKRTE